MNSENPNPSTPPLFGLVLAGGRSIRMGTDKACLTHPDGRSMARRAWELLRESGCEKVALSLRADQSLPTGFDASEPPIVLRDAPGMSDGPIAGILAAFEFEPAARWLVLPCDLPRLDSGTLQTLIGAWDADSPFIAYRSEFDGLPEPLCAIYSPSARALLEAAVADGTRCPRKLLIRMGCPLLDLPVHRALENSNTPEEWDKAIPT